MKAYRIYTKISHDLIPDYVFGGSILDIGADLGFNQINCRHSKRFLEANKNGNYLGIEIKRRDKPLLNIIETDIFKWRNTKKYDLILAIELIEHIQFRDWVKLFNKLKNWVAINGYLVITTPANESLEKYLQNHEKTILGVYPFSNYYQTHVVFGITKKVIRYFLPNAKINTYYRKSNRIADESWFRTIARFFKRILILDSRVFPQKFSYIVIWCNEK